MPGVNLSPDSNNIFSQPQKTPYNALTNESARVDAPGRANSKREAATTPARLREALSEEQLWPALWFPSFGQSGFGEPRPSPPSSASVAVTNSPSARAIAATPSKPEPELLPLTHLRLRTAMAYGVEPQASLHYVRQRSRA